VIERSTRSPIRLAELLAVLSLETDLGMGQPMEHVMRECLIALRLAERVGLDKSRSRGPRARGTGTPTSRPGRSTSP